MKTKRPLYLHLTCLSAGEATPALPASFRRSASAKETVVSDVWHLEACCGLWCPALWLIRPLACCCLIQDHVDALVGALEQAALSLESNLKFGKLLLTVITMFPRKIAIHKSCLEQVLRNPSTFMTKAALAKLKKV
eukprot:6774230-Pyramimonas_sp.AAC.1